MLEIQTAVDCFVESFAYVLNFSQPCEVVQHGMLRSVKHLASPDGRAPREEIVAPVNWPAAEVVEAIREYGPSPDHIVDVFLHSGESVDERKAAYAQQGYRHVGYEPVMAIALPLTSIRSVVHSVQRVGTVEQARRVASNAREKLITDELLASDVAPVRLYYVEQEGEVIAWGRSVLCTPGIASVAGMSTNEDYRRRGIASAILQRMLLDDAAQGATYSMLLASPLGQMLYRKFGFETIGTVQIFEPL